MDGKLFIGQIHIFSTENLMQNLHGNNGFTYIVI